MQQRWLWLLAIASLPLIALPSLVQAEGDWEVTPASEAAIEKGLSWLARSQGKMGNWDSNDLGLVSMGALAFLADGHMPGRGKYGENVDLALDYVLRHAKVQIDPQGRYEGSGLLNVSNGQRDMYNHGLSTFVLGQAYGMTNNPRMRGTLELAIKLICNTQCDDGGWDYNARKQAAGHDLSLAVMQAKALRSAVDSGFDIPQEVIDKAIQGVRTRYRSRSGKSGLEDEATARSEPGQFTYNGGGGTLAMAAAGVVCMQEFGQYDDWRIGKNMEFITAQIQQLRPAPGSGNVPWDGYTLYYVGQALYQVGGNHWRENYPKLRDAVVAAQGGDGHWRAVGHVSGAPGDMYGTAVACFILSMPNRYLPILQEGKIEAFVQKYQKK